MKTKIFKSSFHEKLKLFIIPILLLTLGVGQMWADYYYRGGKNSWGATAMTVHSSGLYEYYSTSAANFNGDRFKISKTTSGYDYNQAYVAKGFNGGVNDIGDYGGDDCYIWSSSNGYIIVYYPNTLINTTSSPKITFRTSLYSPTFYIKHPWGGGSWTWQTMSNNSTTKKYTYTGVYSSSSGANVYTSKTDNNYLTPSGTSDVNNNVPAIWTYNAKNNTLSIAPAYTLTVQADGHGSASGSVAKGIAMSTKYSISASSPSTGYHFYNWTRVSGGTCTFDNASSASTKVTVTGDASATVQANFALNTYTVAYNANDDNYPGTATGSTSSSSHTYSTAKKLTSNGFSRTGYTFAGWATSPTGDVTYSDGQSVTNLTSTNGATVTLYAKWTENMSDVTLAADPEGKGTFTIGGAAATSTTAGVTTTRSVTAVPIAGYSFDSWSISGGASISSTSTNPTTITGGGAGTAATLTATFVANPVYYDVTFGVGTSYTSLGSISATNNTTSSSISSGDDILSASSITFTASPNTGYTVEGWYTNAACTEGKHDAGSTTYTIASLSSAVTVYVKFVEKTWSVAFAAGTGGTVTTPAATPQTVGQLTGISIAATPGTGYTFKTWTITSGSGSFTSAVTTNSNKFKPTAASTITASFNETMSSLSTSCHYDVGNPSYAAPAVAGSATTVGYGTTRSITAAAAGTGYRFTGWTLTNCTRTDGGGATANPITIRSNGDGAAASVVANYEEVLTQSTWIVAGGNKIVTSGTTWRTTADANNSMVKKTGHSTESVVYFTVPVTTVCSGDNNENFQFKIYNTSTSKWYGLFASGSYYLLKAEDGIEKSLVQDNQNIELRAYVTGDYEFKLDYSTSTPKLTVTWPVFNQVRISAASPTDATNVGNFDLSDPVSNVRTVTRSLKANTTYTFKIVYNSDFYGYNSGTFTRSTSTSSNERTISTSGGDMTLTTDYAGDYTFKFNQSTKALSVDFPAAYKITFGKGSVDGTSGSFSAVDLDNGSAAVTSNSTWVKSGHKVKITAPAGKTGYKLKGWYDNNSGTGEAITTNANCTITVNTTKTVYACYVPKTSALSFNYQTSDPGYKTSGTISAASSATYDAALPALSGNVPTAKSGYAFIGFFDGTGDGAKKYYNADKSSAVTKWDKNTESETTLYAHYQKAEISSLTHNATVAKGDEVTLDVNPVLSVTPVDYVKICWTLHYSENDNEVPTSTSADHYYSVEPYTESGAKPLQVRITMHNLAIGSYYVKAVLKASASSGFDPCSTGTELDTKNGEFNIIGSSTITIRYMYYVTGDYIASNGSVEIPAEGNEDITAPDIVGYTFREWSLGAGVNKNSGALTDATINISSTYDGVVTAFYNKRDVIYFNNTLGWDDVYVYFYNTDKEYWANNYGTGANKKQYFNGKYPFGDGYYGHMTQIEGTNVWYFDYQAASIPTLTKVAFANKEQVYDKTVATNAEAYFHDASVVYRTDFDATHLPMFVPIDAVKHDYTTNTGSKYYHGYWMNYPDNTGYTLKIYNKQKKTDTPDSGSEPFELKSIPFTFSANKAMPMNLTVDLEGGKTYGFKIYRNDNKWYGNGGIMKNGNSGDSGQTAWEATTNTDNCGLKTTSTGDYVFTFRYGIDNYDNYNYLIGVKYPEAVGNHRVVYTDAANWSGTAHVAQTWTLESRVIPAMEDATDTVSFFVSKGSSPQFKIEKVTAISGEGVPTWSQEVGWTSCNDVAAAGVYNFIMTQDGSKNMSLSKKELYDGNFYIRVDGAGTTDWEHYRSSDHIMPYSEYSFNQTTDPYSHYYAHWYDCSGGNKNIKFVVANDYSPRLTDYIAREGIADSYVDTEGNLSRSANVRFMYNYKTNVATRRYVDGAYAADNDFLLLIPSNNTSIYDSESAVEGKDKVRFKDNGNWIYEANVWVVPNTQYKLKSQFGTSPAISQYLKGKASGDDQYETLIGGSGSRMKIRLLYDFKTNRLIAAYLPSGTISENMVIDADVMFERVHQGDVTQITFGENKSISAIQNVYSTLKFNKSTINNLALSRYERDMFYISFPYDVRVSDIIGFGNYGKHWIIEYYDGADRAEKGFWKDSKTFWKFVTPAMASSYTLKAGTGYIVALDLDELGNSSTIWENTSTVELIFPGDISSISNQSVTYNIPKHQCNIGPRWEGADDRRIADSHWNIMGIPAYHNTTGTFANHTDEIGNKSQVWSANGKPYYLYTWNMTDNSLSVTDATGYNYRAMHAYVVQYYGNVTFTTSTNAAPASVAARKYTNALSDVKFRMEIQQNDEMVDQTFVKLINDDAVSKEFVFGEDLSKEFNKNKANIYTMVTTILNDTATVTEVAGNTLPMSTQTTVVPVGVMIVEDGEYIFSMPDGTEGIGVTLIDLERGTRTNLSAIDYAVSLEAGTYNERFMLEISPIQQTVTAIEAVNGDNSNAAQNGVCKKLIDGVLYIVKDGKVFDARGARIQ